MFQYNNIFRKEFKLFLIILIPIILFLYVDQAKKNNIPKVSQGKIDLSNWDFEKNGVAKLDGEWELYFDQLLEPKDFKDINKNEPGDFFYIPNSFNDTIRNNKLPKSGYGTMRIKIKMQPNDDSLYGIKSRYILSASKIWINGQAVSSAGVVGKNSNSAIGSFEHQIAFFKNDSNEVEIVIQMSNFNNVTGKIQSISLGNDIQIKREYVKSIALDAFIIGALFIMGIYHFTLYYKRPKYKAPLYFGIFCLLISFRNILTGERIIFEILPSISFSLFNKIAYLTIYSAFPFVVMFFKELFPEELSSKMADIVKIISVFISLVTIITNIDVYDIFLVYYEICIVIFLIYVLFITIRAVINRKQGALIILFGFAVFLTASIHDMLLQAGILHSRSLLPFGLFIFIFSQSYILAVRFSDAFIEIEKLVEENKAIYKDELTGILNRRGFYVQGGNLFKATFTTGSGFILFFGDLNKLKTINDSFGHKEGDEAIKKTAYLLKNSFEKDDIVARMSGDEFTAIAVDKASEEDAKKIIKRIKNNFHKYNLNSKKPYDLSISIGYSIYMSNANTSLEELINEADSMLYDNKAIVKNSNFQ